VPLNPLLAPPEVEQRISASEATLLVDEPLATEGSAPPGPPVSPGDAAVILFTSGTSGRPKGAVLTHDGILLAAGNVRRALGLGTGDVILGSAPFSHVLGLTAGLVAGLSAGSATVVLSRFRAEDALAVMVETGTTVLLGVPTMCIALNAAARAAPALPRLRVAHVGGAGVPLEVGRAFERTFGCPICEGYGLTEMSGVATTYTLDQRRKPGSVGTPLAGTEMRIAAPDASGIGEVQFRGPTVVPGYWRDLKSTREAIDADGWLATGDLGRVDGDGYLFLVDRKKDVVLRGGYTVYPRAVEEALYLHPEVLEAAVVGVPDDVYGEEVAALVVLKPGAGTPPEELRAWTRRRVAAYAYPRLIAIVDDLPKGPTGKIVKRALALDGLRWA
jgi:long-chain acyl-CoA synthetase